MTDLEIYSAYLPYEVKYATKEKRIGSLKVEVRVEGIVDYRSSIHSLSKLIDNERYKLILRPLSDIRNNENISLRREFDGLIKNDLAELWYVGQTEKIDLSKISAKTYLWLLKNHYDVFGRIEQGKAIDINTL